MRNRAPKGALFLSFVGLSYKATTSYAGGDKNL